MNAEILMKARALLTDATPMARDCGRLCGAACCQTDEDGQGGVYLFPGEEALLGRLDWARVSDDARELGGKKARLIMCDGPCDREKRPLACMIFPLTVDIDQSGEIDVRFDARARAMCPLLRHGVRGLSRNFVEKTEQALRLIAQDEEGLRFLKDWQALEEQYDLRL